MKHEDCIENTTAAAVNVMEKTFEIVTDSLINGLKYTQGAYQGL